MRMNVIKSKLDCHPGTIGQLEALAGIEPDEATRRAFWVTCNQDAKNRFNVSFASGEQVFQVGRERCYKMIAARIKGGRLSLI